MIERREDETQIGEPPTLRVWWTAHMRNVDGQTNDHWYVARSGYWHGTVLELVAWFTCNAEAMRAPTLAHRLAPELMSVRQWPSTLEILNAAALALSDEVPSLLPLPPGKGILYVSGHVTESDWIEIRDAAHGRRRLSVI